MNLTSNELGGAVHVSPAESPEHLALRAVARKGQQDEETLRTMLWLVNASDFFPLVCSLRIFHRFAVKSISDHSAQMSDSVLTKVRAINLTARRVREFPWYNSIF